MEKVHYESKAETIAVVGEASNLVINKKDEAPSGGLTVITTSVFIVGVIAGSGFLSLPMAVDYSGWYSIVGVFAKSRWVGFPLLFICCMTSAFTAHILGKCWTIVLDLNPDMRGRQIRYPYQAIGEQAFGRLGRYIVSFSISFTMFGATVVYVLLCADNITNLLGSHFPHGFCYLVLIIGGVMTPLTWLGTPKDFWGIALAASTATGVASLILFGSILHYSSEVKTVEHSDVGFVSFFTAYGIFSSAYCGHPAFPTFQSDMKKPSKFGRAVLLGYLIVFLTYLPSTTAAYFVYGKDTASNVLNTIPGGALSTIVSVLMTVHLLFGIVIVINPVTQDLEHIFNVPENFTWKRLVTRTLTMVAVVFVAESVPHFSSILALIGGSTISVLSYICPPMFYLKLRRDIKSPPSLVTKVILYEITLIGIIAGIAATYSAIKDLDTNKMTVPCYVDHIRAWKRSS